MRNLLASFDEFEENDDLSERDFQDYCGRYQDIRDELRPVNPDKEKEDIIDDIVFEMELLKQVEINIDYILMMVQKYHDSHCKDKEILVAIQKAVDSSPNLRSKKKLIETFIANIITVDDVATEWQSYVAEEREKELKAIIQEEKLKETETRKYISNAFREGEIKTSGTDIDAILPPISRFGGGGSKRSEKKKTVIGKLKAFVEKFFGIGGGSI